MWIFLTGGLKLKGLFKEMTIYTIYNNRPEPNYTSHFKLLSFLLN